MKFRSFILLILIVVAGILFYMNPDEQTHKTFVKDKFTVIFNQKVEEELEKIKDPNLKIFGNLGKKLAPLLGNNVVDELVDTHVRRKNYYLFSTTEVLYKEKWNTIGIGVAGKMYLFPQVEEELQKLDLKSEALKLMK